MTKTQIAAARKSLAAYWSGSVSASVASDVAAGKTNHCASEKASAKRFLASLRKGVV